MAYNIIADFFNVINASLFTNVSILMVIGYVIWEIPRSVKVLSEEYTEGLYPEGGRILDLFIFIVGLLAFAYIFMGANVHDTVRFLKAPGVTAFILIVMVVIPFIIFLGFLKNAVKRIEGNSVTVFLAQTFLDLMRTLFYISVVLLLVPALSFLLFGGMVG